MTKTFAPFAKLLVPIVHGCAFESALAAARAIVGEGRGRIVLAGFVGVEADDSLSAAAALARRVRKTLRGLTAGTWIRGKARVRVSHTPWAELVGVVEEERPDLLLLEWPCHFDALRVTVAEALRRPPCDVGLVRGSIQDHPARVLVPLRGGPYAELALRVSLAATHGRSDAITSLHLTAPSLPAEGADKRDVPFQGLRRVLRGLPEVARREAATEDPAGTIVSESRGFDLVVIGATARPAHSSASLGPVADQVLRECPAGVIAVKTRRPMPAEPGVEAAGAEAISILVDKWFAENTFHADEFADLDHMLGLKRQQNLTISLALPALNEEETVAKVIRTVKEALMDSTPLLDEIVLIDSDSVDRTREIARQHGLPVYVHQHVLSEHGARQGKGEALWKSLHVTGGDLVVWVDTDIVNIHPRFVYGILGPLLSNRRIQLVKGFYRRPLKVGDKVQAGGGGRVTELTARPLLNLFYPELAGVVQPLSGEYGGRRAALETLPFFSGYGVETGLLIDMFEKYGLSAIAQVDLLERVHHNQPLDALSKMSFAIIQAVIRKLERRYGAAMLDDVNRSMKLIRHSPRGYFLDVEEIAERERPPMIEIPEYLAQRQKRPA
ncbi:MAG: glucosyl-3-phosphoglycerate synthase [Chloroflexi bacterium]|nr:glucosyl-3-phosphoglycerate synthase [Chloroflexota bacterium]